MSIILGFGSTEKEFEANLEREIRDQVQEIYSKTKEDYFDAEFDEASFFAMHVFRQEVVTLFDDLVCRAEILALLDAAMSCFDAAVQAIPLEWLWLDGEARTLPVQVDFDALKRRLSLRARLERGFQ